MLTSRGSLPGVPNACTFPGCGKPAARRGRCWTHVPRPVPSRLCEVDECERLALNGPLCEGHRKQVQRHGKVVGPLGPPLGRPIHTSPVDRLLAAALGYSDAPAEDERAYAKALRELFQAAAIFEHAARSAVPARTETPLRAEEDTSGGEAA